ncbi:hypothetical protein ACOMHN_022279 [Nucella lapillus]
MCMIFIVMPRPVPAAASPAGLGLLPPEKLTAAWPAVSSAIQEVRDRLSAAKSNIMRPAMGTGVTLILLVTAVQTFAQLTEVRRPYDSSNPDDIAELMKYYDETQCESIGLGNNSFQKLKFYAFPGGPQRVYAFPVEVCPSYMIFDAKTCRCQTPGFIIDNHPAGRGTTPCTSLADISYHEGKGQYTSSTFVRETDKEASADLGSLTARSVQGRSGRQALRISGQPLVVESFVDNQLMGPWSSSLRFLPESSSGRSVLLSDDCNKLGTDKSMELALDGGRLEVFLRFGNDSLSLKGRSCPIRPDVDGWYTVQMTSLNGTVSVTVNGQICVSSDPGEHAVLAQTRCPLYVGGDARGSSSSFTGLIEYFKFKKGPQEKCTV